MNPQLTVGVFDQHIWPGAGDTDDCFVVASLMAVATVAPWLYLPTVTNFRAAAGNPDDAGVIDGGTIPQVARALRALYPKLDIQVSTGDISWSTFLAKVKAGHPAVVFIWSSGLKPEYQFGWTGGHAVAVAWDGDELKLGNPLDRAHKRWRTVSASELESAVKAWPGTGVYCVLMPTVEDAFKTHPLQEAAQAQLDAQTATIASLQTQVSLLQVEKDSRDDAITELQAALATEQEACVSAHQQLGAALNKVADLQAQLDTANQALSDARLSLGRWDALKRLFRELLGLSN